jgi:hypothetical protein
LFNIIERYRDVLKVNIPALSFYCVVLQLKIKEKVNMQKAIIHSEKGDMTIEFYQKDAPKTVENFIT